MFKVLKVTFVAAFGLLGFAWELLVGFLRCVPDAEERKRKYRALWAERKKSGFTKERIDP